MVVVLEDLINRGIKTTDFFGGDIETYKDERIKIYFLGNKPSLHESQNPELHFLAVPRDYTLTEFRPPENIIKFSISQNKFSADYFNEGMAEEVRTKKAYVLLTNLNYGKEQYVLPFQTEDSFRYKIFLKNMESRLLKIYENYFVLDLGIRCKSQRIIDENGMIELRKRAEEFVESTDSLYNDLRERFAEEIDSTEPLEIKLVKKEHRRLARNALGTIDRLKGCIHIISKVYIDDQISSNKKLEDFMTNPVMKKVIGSLYDSAKRYYSKKKVQQICLRHY